MVLAVEFPWTRASRKSLGRDLFGLKLGYKMSTELLILIIVLVVLFGGGGGYYWNRGRR